MSTHLRAIRLRVLLDDFYAEGDHRRKALIILQKSWTTVAQLQQHIQSIFRLPGQIFLTIEDGLLLPSDEDIGVVSELDSITVRPVRTSFNLLTDAFSNAHIYSANETTPGEWTSGDLSSPGIFSSQSAPKRQRRLQLPTAASAAAASAHPVSPCKSSIWIKDIDSLDVVSGADEKPAVSDADTLVRSQNDAELPAKPKRQRKRKRKATATAAAPIARDQPKVAGSKATEAKQEPTAIFRVERVCLSPGHIRFEDPADVSANNHKPQSQGTNSSQSSTTSTSAAAAPPPKNPTRLNPFALPGTARVIRGTCTRSAAAQAAGAQQSAPASVASPSGCRPATPDRWRAPAAAFDAPAAVVEKVSALETLRRNVASMQLVAVDKPLRDKDMVAFRIMKLSADYVPGLSEYIIGMVQSVDAATGLISLHIMAGHEQTQEPQGKFSLQPMDGMEDGTAAAAAAVDRTFCVQRANMHDAKYVEL